MARRAVRARGPNTRTRLKRGDSASVEGFDDLYRALKELPRATERGVLKKVGKAAMEPIAARARQLAPVLTGKLRDSIAVKVGFDDAGYRERARASFRSKGHARGVKKTKGGGELLTQVKAGGNAAPHASLIELGTVRLTAHPFLRPAFDGERDATLKRIRDALTTEIGKAVKRRARKLAKQSAGQE